MTPVFDEKTGELTHFMAFELDVTKEVERERELQERNHELQKMIEEYRQAQEELGALNEKLQENLRVLEDSQEHIRLLSSIFTRSYNANVIFDRNLEIIWANPAFVQLMGYTLSEAHATARQVMLDIVGGDEALLESLARELERKFSLKREIHTRRKDGTYFWSLTTISCLLDEVGQLTHYLVTLVDVTEQKQAYLLLQEQMKELEDSATYAERIQKALIPKLDVAESHGLRAKLFYQPKYKIGGDFVWVSSGEEDICFGIGDSTGHGVPGAMLGMLFLQLLKESFSLNSRALRKVIPTFHQKLLAFQENAELKDSLELSLVRITSEVVEVFTTSAQPVFIQAMNGQVEEISMRAHLGRELILQSEGLQLGVYEVPRKELRRVYLMTDGIRDTIGGSAQKRFGSPRVRAVLNANAHEDLSTVVKELRYAIETWRGSTEQMDDYLMLAIELH